MLTHSSPAESWMNTRIQTSEIGKYMKKGRDFIDEGAIEARLTANANPEAEWIRDIIAKSLAIETLTPDETAALLNVNDPELLHEMEQAAGVIKKKVYDNRIVTFAPLYLSNLCVNNCVYCGFRRENRAIQRRTLMVDEIRREAEVLCGEIGHKRLIVVYGEHPVADIDYMVQSIETIYSVNMQTKNGWSRIRRVNVNAAPLSVADLKRLHEVGIGTYQVFQETYHHKTYSQVHPAGTLKAHYPWRAYCMHRAFEAGIDDFGIGALFGLYDWKFEVVALVCHARELEEATGIGPHTISFPRIEPAENTPFAANLRYRVSDIDFRKAITVIRLAVPYTGMILTARERAGLRHQLLPLGITQIDASSRIGIGAYSDQGNGDQHGNRQQFLLGDTRSLDEVIRDLARQGCITSFCTAGYRCGRTGKSIMDLLRSGREGKFCKLNAVLTFREWLDDFAGDETRALGESLIAREIEEIRTALPSMFETFMQYYRRTCDGESDLYF
ncbi:MAG: [FeFe] hydrogenase H-cluster radical SAM maturase HydG [Desulforhabdus sp.]|jgi:2-iminoacetate synthase|nr:[FeFe] hydrogenase H-cluster radical SAM maturase HydG [Desulforhabdus sp.]